MTFTLTALKDRSGFTLIELLIVVAIIAILAAIAVPNFLEAQTRAKVSRAQTDMRSIATAIESYRVDNNNYPQGVVDQPFAPAYLEDELQLSVVGALTTPISYLTTFPEDAFKGTREAADPLIDPLGLQLLYDYRRTRLEKLPSGETTIFESATGFGIGVGEDFDSWLLYSPGPDKEQNINTGTALNGTVAVSGFGDPIGQWPFYDPTNGTISVGDIIRSPQGNSDTLAGR